MACPVCSHDKRKDIEVDLLNVSKNFPLEEIAEKYGLSTEELAVHCVVCNPEEGPEVSSIGREIKRREAIVLEETVYEYSSTLRILGSKIRKYANNDDGVNLPKFLTKPIADTYIGLGSEIRQSTRALAELNNLLNGKPDDGLSGLAALARAINGSGNS